MSIIHDALKKVQANLDHKVEPEIPPKDISKIYEKLYQRSETPAPSLPPAPPLRSSPPKASSVSKTAGKPTGQKPAAVYSDSEHKRKIWPQLVVTLTLFTILWVAVYILIQQNLLKQISAAIPSLQKPPAKSRPSRASLPPSPSDALILQGIMGIDNNKRVALINDEIYEAGQSVNGKKIVNITLEKVELEDPSGKITTLRVK